MKYLFKKGEFNLAQNNDRVFDQVFVCKENYIYIMDNHRAALWCWLQEVSNYKNKQFSLLHIDNHPDMSPVGIHHCKCATKLNILKLGLREYLEVKHNCEEYKTIPIFSYENFLRYFIENFPNIIDSEDVYITHNQCEDKPSPPEPKVIEAIEKFIGREQNNSLDCSLVVGHLYREDLLNLSVDKSGKDWIIDIDLDYFYNEKTHSLDIELAQKVFNLLKRWHDTQKVTVITIAWSPEFMINREKEGLNIGIERAESLNKEFCKIFNVDFKF